MQLTEMDEIARRYVLLGLRLERHVRGFVDSYIGPPELAEVVAGEEPVTAMALHDEALRLQELAHALPANDDQATRRREWLQAQLRAMRALARQAAGEEIGYLDLVEELLDIRPAIVPEEHFAEIRARFDAALPPGGSLADRYAKFTTALHVPADRVMDAMRGSTERFRTASRRDFDFPAAEGAEGIDWGDAHDQPWGAEARFTGDGRTLVRLNLDLPRDVTVIAYLASHEGYPGHHLDHITKERTLVRQRGVGEATLRTIDTPESVLAEGVADVAREVVMTDVELSTELRRISREAGIEGAQAELEAAVQVGTANRALTDAANGNAAIMLQEEGRPADEVREFLLETTARPPELVAQMMRTLMDPIGRTYLFTYSAGSRLIRAWLEVQGQTTGFARLLAEQHTPSGLARESSETDAA